MSAISPSPDQFSTALSAAQAAAVCPACGVDWSTTLVDESVEVRRLPPCGHSICLGCYASLYWAVASESGSGGPDCPACGSACLLHPENLPRDPAMPRLLQLLRLWRSQQQPTQPQSPSAHLLELPAPSYSPAYLQPSRGRPLLLCLHRDANNQKLEAINPDTGSQVAELALSSLRDAVTLTGVFVCPALVAGSSPRLLLADRYRDRLHVADLTGRCLQTVEAGPDARPGHAWVDSKGALVVTRNGAEMLVMSWDNKDRLVRDGTVLAISGRPLASLRSLACIGGQPGKQQQVLMLHSGGVSVLDRRQLMRRLRRAASDAGGAAENAKACDVPADATSFEPKEFGLTDCTAMLVAENIGCRDTLLFLAGQELQDAGVNHPIHIGPMHGIRILRADDSASPSGWRLVASVGCRCRCDRCFRGCSDCCHLPRYATDGMALDEAGRRLFVCRRGSRFIQVVTLPPGL